MWGDVTRWEIGHVGRCYKMGDKACGEMLHSGRSDMLGDATRWEIRHVGRCYKVGDRTCWEMLQDGR